MHFKVDFFILQFENYFFRRAQKQAITISVIVFRNKTKLLLMVIDTPDRNSFALTLQIAFSYSITQLLTSSFIGTSDISYKPKYTIKINSPQQSPKSSADYCLRLAGDEDIYIRTERASSPMGFMIVRNGSLMANCG